MRVVLLGISHRTAPVEVREKLTFTQEQLPSLLTALKSRYPVAEFLMVCTCNRTELYAARPTHGSPTMDELRALLAQQGDLSVQQLTAVSIHREETQALKHLFRVCSGLDSMVLGETQILGQVKRSYEAAVAAGSIGAVLHKVFQQALAAAKQIRSDTDIDAGRMSVGSVAVDFARQIFEDFSNKVVVGIGAGGMAKITLKHLLALKPRHLWLINRSPQRAASLAQRLELDGHGGGVRPWDELDQLLVEADIIITSTGATEPIITAAQFKAQHRRRRNRPLFLVDIAVPRDIDPAIGQMSNVYLYDIDDLQAVVAKTQEDRSEQVQRCEEQIAKAVASCMVQIQNRDLDDLIKQLRGRLHEIGKAEQQRSARRLAALQTNKAAVGSGVATEEQAATDILSEHTNRLINKILHLPLSQLKHPNPDVPLGFYGAALRRLFDLQDRPPTEPTLSDDNQPPAAG